MDPNDPTNPPPVLGVAAAGLPFPQPYHPLYSPELYQHQQQHHLLQPHQPQPQSEPQSGNLQLFWADQYREIEQTTDFRNHSLPLARIKKIMKADEDVRMIAAEAPVVFARACEMFVLQLTYQSWLNAEENRRRTLQQNDVFAAITRTEVFDFLVDIVPGGEQGPHGGGGGGVLPVGPPVDGLPFYYGPP